MYFGDSDGSAPFVGALIEHNVIVDTVGYNLQIKHQLVRPSLTPAGPTQTVIRHNVFSKANGGATDGMARPNVLLGHFPLHGAGPDDSYSVYGNFFHENPYEALLQVEGNVRIHGNIFLNSGGDALRVVPHKALPQRIAVRHNTIVARGTGILIVGGDQRFLQEASANAVFAAQPIIGGMQRDNVADSFAKAGSYLLAPLSPLGQIDFSPLNDHLLLTTMRRSGGESPEQGDFYGRLFDRPTAGAVASALQAPWLLDRAIQPAKN